MTKKKKKGSWEPQQGNSSCFLKLWSGFEVFLDEVDLTPKVTVNKELHIDNPRLVMLNIVLTCGSILTIVGLCVFSHYHLLTLGVETSMFVELHTESFDRARDYTIDDSCSPCSCVPICQDNRSSSCNEHNKLKDVYRQISPESVRVALSRTVWNGTARSAACEHFKYTEELELKLGYLASAISRPWPKEGKNKYRATPANAATVVRDRRNQVAAVFQTGQSVKIRLGDLPNLVQNIPDDTVGTGSWDSFFGSLAQHGASIIARTNCYLSGSSYWSGIAAVQGMSADLLNGDYQHICIVEFEWSHHGALEITESKIAEDAYMAEERTLDIHCVMGTSGEGAYLDLTNLLTSLTTLYVLLEWPNKFLRVFAIVGLGKLSAIYRRGIRERLDVNDELACTATELVTMVTAYDSMLAHSKQESEVPISFLHSKLTEAMPLHEEEVLNLLSFALSVTKQRELDDGHHWSMREELHDVLSHDTYAEKQLADPPEGLSIGAFMSSVSQNRLVDLRHLNSFFSKDRSVGFFEKVFTPLALRKAAARIPDVKKTMKALDGDVNGKGGPDSESAELESVEQSDQQSRAATAEEEEEEDTDVRTETASGTSTWLKECKLQWAKFQEQQKRELASWREECQIVKQEYAHELAKLQELRLSTALDVSEKRSGPQNPGQELAKLRAECESLKQEYKIELANVRRERLSYETARAQLSSNLSMTSMNLQGSPLPQSSFLSPATTLQPGLPVQLGQPMASKVAGTQAAADSGSSPMNGVSPSGSLLSTRGSQLSPRGSQQPRT